MALHQALDKITATFGKGSIMWMGRAHVQKEVPVVSTGSFSLDIALGICGFPKKYYEEFFFVTVVVSLPESTRDSVGCFFLESDGCDGIHSGLIL
ncbi:hypothetical protein Taro_024987 [Colocasia esculenta]|uniref:RecA-like N-terminal domain-containing protein n=1 Tax=Colocasia esculenta TaxID=4460 RepID=A0A843VAY5_COLES|nr:hypothetical protein [Colocasia esculenta]